MSRIASVESIVANSRLAVTLARPDDEILYLSSVARAGTVQRVVLQFTRPLSARVSRRCESVPSPKNRTSC